MTRVGVKGFKIFPDRHGKVRCYHRATGTPIDLAKAPIGSAEFFAECARITALAVVATPKPGTLGLLVASIAATRPSPTSSPAPGPITSACSTT
jgi:hypothetical protein